MKEFREFLLRAKRDFTRFSFIVATVFTILTYVLWFIAPEWHIIPECVAFYWLGVWAAEVNLKLRDWLLSLIIIAIISPIINQDISGFIITGYFTFVCLIGYLYEKRLQNKTLKGGEKC